MKIITFILVSTFFLTHSEEDNIMSNKTTRKKIDNAIATVIRAESFSLQPLVLPLDSIFANEGSSRNGNYFLILEADAGKGLLYAGSAKGRYDWFDFIVIFNQDLLIEKVEIITYREDHGLEITNKAWLAQFKGKTGCETGYGKDIDAVSGATLSANSLMSAISEICWELRDNGYTQVR